METNEQLVEAIQAGRDAAENLGRLYGQNSGFIRRIAGKYAGYVELDDLMQEGYFGLYEAVKHFESGHDVLFMTYAAYWIEQSMRRYVISCCRTVRIPEDTARKVLKCQRFISAYRREYGRKPSDEEIGCLMGIGEEALENIKAAACMERLGSLDVPIDESEESTLYDLVPCADDSIEHVLEEIQQEQLRAAIWPLVDALPGNLPYVIRARYQEQRTLADIAEENGVTIEAIRQKEKKAMHVLRLPRNARKLRPYLSDAQAVAAYHGSGVQSFNRTWTSSTERAALM